MSGDARDPDVARRAARASRIAPIGCTVPPPKLWVFSTTTSEVSTW